MGKTHELDHPFSNATIGISSPHYPLQHASCTRCFEQGISLKADEIVFLFDLAGRTRSHGSRSRSHSISRVVLDKEESASALTAGFGTQ